jgi:general secretion pathway protein H
LRVRRRPVYAPGLGRERAGFTLVEMMIVIALMALAMTFLGPMLPHGTSPRALERLSTSVALAARRARTESMRHNLETALVFDAASRAFLVLPGWNRMPLPDDVTVTVSTSKIMADGSRPAIRFLPDGRSSGGEIRLATRAASVRLVVDWLTGWPRRVPS